MPSPAGHVEPDRVPESVEQLDLVGPQLPPGPVRDVDGGLAAAGDLDQLPVGVATDQQAPLAQPDQPVETGIGPAAWSPVTTIRSAAATSGSASTASRTGRTPWMSERTATVATMTPP